MSISLLSGCGSKSAKKEDAETIKEQLELQDITITQIITENVEEINTHELEVAKNNVAEKTQTTDKSEGIANIDGIEIATLPITGTISSRYGVSSRIRSSTHTGLDIAASTGTPIKVIADGTVTSAQYTGSYGYLVKVEHGNGVESWYAHTSKMYVKAGDEVKAGDVITVRESKKDNSTLKMNIEETAARPVPAWLERDSEKLSGKVIRLSAREDIDLPIEEHLIVELYSK